MHIQKFSDEAMRDAHKAYLKTPFGDSVLAKASWQWNDWQAALRILLADVNAQIAAHASLKPLTYAEACALKRGDKVVCLDTEFFKEELRVGCQYPVTSISIDGSAIIDLEIVGTFSLTKQDCNLFAAVPSTKQSPPAPDATMQLVVQVLSEFSNLFDVNEYDGTGAISYIAHALGLEILPAQPIPRRSRRGRMQ